MRKCLSLLLFFLTALSAFAQKAILTGSISNEDESPLAGVSVRVYSDTLLISRAATDNKGKFSIEIAESNHANNQTYTIAISCLGYESQTFNLQDCNESMDLGTIKLKAATKNMGEAVVTTDRITHSSEKIVKIPSKTEKEHSSNAITLLNQMNIANLQVDIMGGTVEANGSKIPIYINFMPATDTEIASLHPDEIVRVEYNVQPKGEFIRVGKVINIITRPLNHGGLLMGQAVQAEEVFGYYTLSYQLYHKKNQFTFAYTGNYTNEKYYTTTTERFENPTDGSIIQRHTIADGTQNKRQLHAAMFGYNYKNDSFSSKLLLTYVQPKNPTATNQTLRTQDGTDEMTFIKDITSNQSHSPKLKWDMRKKWNNNILNINTELQYSKNHYNNLSEYTYSFTDQQFRNNNIAKEDFYQLRTSLSYTTKVGKAGNITAYYDNLHQWTIADYLGNSTNTSSNWLHYGEDMLMATYGLSLKNGLYLQATMGATHFISKTHGIDKPIENWYPRPSLNINYDFKKANINFSTFTGNGSPDISMTGNIEQTIDDLQIKASNPYIRTERFWAFILNGYFTIPKGYIYYMCDYQPIFNFAFNDTRYDADRQKYIHSINSNGDWHSLKLSLDYASTFSQKIKIQIGTKWTFQKEVADKGSNNITRSLSYPSANASIQYLIGPMTFQLSGSTTNRTLRQGYGHTRARVDFLVSFNKPRYAIMLYASNLASTYRNYRWTTTGSLYRKTTDLTLDSGKRRCFINLIFTFNLRHGNKKYQFSDDKIDQSINSGILK